MSASLGAIAFFVGEGSSQLAAGALFAGPSHADAQATAPMLSARTTRDGCTMLDGRSFMDSTLELRCDEARPPPLPPTPGGRGAEPSICDPSLRLVGAYVRRGHAEQSLAVIASGASTSALYREGMMLGRLRVLAIRDTSVVLGREDGAPCAIRGMFEADEPVAVPHEVTVTPVLDARPVTPELASHVERITDTSYAIDRSFVEELLARQAWPSARVVPEEENGRVVGMRVFGVRRESLGSRLGIQNGDSLRSVSGYDLTDPVAALEALTRLRSADHVSLSLTRRGEPVTIEYAIR